MADNPKPHKRKTLGSYPFLNVVLSITLALFVIGLFGLLVLHTNKLTQIIRENVEIQVYLKRNISPGEKTKIQKSLYAKDYVLQKQDKPVVKFISKEEAAKDFIEATGEDFTTFLGDNPLHDAFLVNIAPEYHGTQQMAEIKAELEQMSGIFEVVYVDNLIQSINKNLTKISLFLVGFAILLIIAVVLLINNTIKLALFSQRFLIRSMQLIGATRGFIQRPFIVRSMWHGIIAGIIASAALYFVMQYSYTQVEDLQLLQETNEIYILLASLLGVGAFIGILSTFRAVNKYLNMSLDELY
ncbi:MAG: cell division protein FtsX [Candidatus Cyclobacteriaceae bacterium M2_1C_046]